MTVDGQVYPQGIETLTFLPDSSYRSDLDAWAPLLPGGGFRHLLNTHGGTFSVSHDTLVLDHGDRRGVLAYESAGVVGGRVTASSISFDGSRYLRLGR